MDPSDPPGVEQLFEHAPCGHLVADASGRLVLINATLCEWLGYDKHELVAAAGFADLLSIGGRIFHQTHIVPLLRMQGSVAEVKLDLRRKNGTLLPVIVNARELDWKGATFLHAAVFVVEDRHRYERELLLQRQRAEELAAENARGQKELEAERHRAEERAVFAEKLVGTVSHDIRNPLSVIQMSTVLLERSGLSVAQRQVVDRVSRAVKRVHHLVGDLLDFTQAKLGRGLQVAPEEVDLHRSVADSIADLQVANPSREIRHVQRGAQTCVADVNRILQAVGNLASNAIAHGAADRPITVVTESTSQEFKISVHNHGPVIQPQQIPHLFEPMVRGAAADAEGGVGLGLFIVREIVERHHGSIDVDSTQQGGTTFVITIPCHRAAGNR